MQIRFNKHQQLLKNIKNNLKELEALIKPTEYEMYEDYFYRFYHQSFKVYYLQEVTNKFVKILRKISPNKNKTLDNYFEQLIKEGTGKKFEISHNKEWLKQTRPIIEAFCHAEFFVAMAVKYGTMEEAPEMLPSGWGALLTLYRIR